MKKPIKPEPTPIIPLPKRVGVNETEKCRTCGEIKHKLLPCPNCLN